MATNQMNSENIFRAAYDPATQSLQMLPTGGTLVPEKFDGVALTYVASGNGAGEIETVIYSLGGNPICTLTLSYDSQSRLVNVVRS